MRFLSVFTGIVWLSILPLLGQEQEKPKTSEVWLRFATFGLEQNKIEAVIASGEKISDPFDIRGNGFSKVVALPSAERAVTLGKPVKVDGEKLSLHPVTKFRLPEAGKRFLVGKFLSRFKLIKKYQTIRLDCFLLNKENLGNLPLLFGLI